METASRQEDAAEARFRGRWRLSRLIRDHRAGRDARLEGEARFTPDGAGLRLEETGVMETGGAALRAHRVYLWRFPAPGRAEVFFEDGRFFHALDLSAPTPEAAHWCDPDRYALRCVFEGPERWRAEWRVRGPRKDYRMESLYTRLAG